MGCSEQCFCSSTFRATPNILNEKKAIPPADLSKLWASSPPSNLAAHDEQKLLARSGITSFVKWLSMITRAGVWWNLLQPSEESACRNEDKEDRRIDRFVYCVQMPESYLWDSPNGIHRKTRPTASTPSSHASHQESTGGLMHYSTGQMHYSTGQSEFVSANGTSAESKIRILSLESVNPCLRLGHGRRFCNRAVSAI